MNQRSWMSWKSKPSSQHQQEAAVPSAIQRELGPGRTWLLRRNQNLQSRVETMEGELPYRRLSQVGDGAAARRDHPKQKGRARCSGLSLPAALHLLGLSLASVTGDGLPDGWVQFSLCHTARVRARMGTGVRVHKPRCGDPSTRSSLIS